MMTHLRRGYLSYLLRLWQVNEGTDAPWRASLENPQTGARRGFATLAELFSHLEGEVRRVARGQAPGPDGPGSASG